MVGQAWGPSRKAGGPAFGQSECCLVGLCLKTKQSNKTSVSYQLCPYTVHLGKLPMYKRASPRQDVCVRLKLLF